LRKGGRDEEEWLKWRRSESTKSNTFNGCVLDLEVYVYVIRVPKRVIRDENRVEVERRN